MKRRIFLGGILAPAAVVAAVGARGDETDSFLKFAVFKRFACLWDFCSASREKDS